MFVYCVSSACVVNVCGCGFRKIIREVMNSGLLYPFLSWFSSRKSNLVYSFCKSLIITYNKKFGNVLFTEPEILEYLVFCYCLQPDVPNNPRGWWLKIIFHLMLL